MALEVIGQLFLAIILGGIIGLERKYKGKEAGLQTYSLVCLGSCLFTVLSAVLFLDFSQIQGISFDPSRVIQAIAIGMGFIGAGVIFQGNEKIRGITTAAGLWVTAAIGIAVGIKSYSLAVAATIGVLIVLLIFGEIERKFLKQN
jgi:putative Mg2+ transporter-C (MgtC) family protein